MSETFGPCPLMGGVKIPASYPKQADPTTCGIATLAVLAARANADPVYLSLSPDKRERAQIHLHRVASRVGVPWPQALGTSPWALAKLASKATGERHRIVMRGKRFRVAVDSALCRGRDVLVFTGGWDMPGSAWIPRHVVLVLADGTDTRIYAVFEPSSGKVFRVNADDFYAGAPSARASMGHWKNVLCAVVPTE